MFLNITLRGCGWGQVFELCGRPWAVESKGRESIYFKLQKIGSYVLSKCQIVEPHKTKFK